MSENSISNCAVCSEPAYGKFFSVLALCDACALEWENDVCAREAAERDDDGADPREN